MMHLHAKALKKGGITNESSFWKELPKQKVSLWLAKKKGALSTRVASSKEETELFWKLTKGFHPLGWLMLRVCYEGCLRRQDLDAIKWSSFTLNDKGLWKSEMWTQQKNKVDKVMAIDTPTYDEIKLWRQQHPSYNLANRDKIFQGADFDHHHRKFRDLVRQVFRFHRGIRQTLKGLNAHYMRHLMCTNLVDKGMSIEQV